MPLALGLEIKSQIHKKNTAERAGAGGGDGAVVLEEKGKAPQLL